MNTNERNALIGKLLGEGLSLSDVQKTLEREHGTKITYMELRLIASDLEVNWARQDKAKAVEKAQEKDISKLPDLPDDAGDEDDLDALDAAPAGGGRTTVSISKIQRPGAVVSGSVTFKSGVKADWYVDQMGRLGLNPAKDTDQPTPDDIQDFQMELQRMIQSGAMG